VVTIPLPITVSISVMASRRTWRPAPWRPVAAVSPPHVLGLLSTLSSHVYLNARSLQVTSICLIKRLANTIMASELNKPKPSHLSGIVVKWKIDVSNLTVHLKVFAHVICADIPIKIAYD
jgi:hypothetical protein